VPIARRWRGRARSPTDIRAWSRRADQPDDEAAPTPATRLPAANSAELPSEIGEGERKLLKSIVDFGDTVRGHDAAPDVVAIPEVATIGQLRSLFREQEYSRFPVFKDSLDNIAGFVFIKDLVVLGPGDDKNPIAPLVRPAVVVPETKLVPELLRQFQIQQTQCAIVVDEYGGTAGLVTLEDLLEEIVGEIKDEYDVETDQVVDEARPFGRLQRQVDIDRYRTASRGHRARRASKPSAGISRAYRPRADGRRTLTSTA
jgi:CBS domain containing-hemolysin-like protein